ncbi:hypothetical protein OPU71_12265 [Niveibacterium sp. 24ML]|uniref:hypothetical protein n=1 Tax=Niveibacterium sp. 24ML TaxID=2985512 RepID=UPI00226FE9F8|nr:hypothetical protein [Niveibacterium sp. 24ML]MCX9156900.1 hypothetical protein [Niveibacterium sp. 24ML]
MACLKVRRDGLIHTVTDVSQVAREAVRPRFIAAYLDELRAHSGRLRLAAIRNTVIERNLAVEVGPPVSAHWRECSLK